jgi:hypothetical protein
MRSWWAENAEKREPHSHADAEAFGIDLDAIRPLFASLRRPFPTLDRP